MTTDHNEAMRLAGELVAPIGTQTSYQTAHEAAALLRKQSERIAELERLSTGLSTVYNEAMDSLRIAVAERDTLRAEVERLRDAMTVPTIEPNSQNWAGMDGAIAFHLIERHADSWADAGRMMSEWREANDTARKATQ